MRRTGMWVVLGAALTVAISMTATAASGAVARSEAKKPIIIGAAMDLTANMAPYDTPALYAVQLQVQEDQRRRAASVGASSRSRSATTS